MKIKEYKEMMAYLTRPDNGMKLFKNSKFSQNNKNKKPIDARTASLNKVSDTQVPPKNTFEQQIINKTKELSEDKITTKRPIVKDQFTKQLINAHNTFDGGPYIVDNETGEVVSEAALKRRFSYQDKPYPKQATAKQMAELKTKVDKYKDIHFPKKTPDPKVIAQQTLEIMKQKPDPVISDPVPEPRPQKERKPLEQIIKEAADRRLKMQQDMHDRQFGRGGIPELKRPI